MKIQKKKIAKLLFGFMMLLSTSLVFASKVTPPLTATVFPTPHNMAVNDPAQPITVTVTNTFPVARTFTLQSIVGISSPIDATGGTCVAATASHPGTTLGQGQSCTLLYNLTADSLGSFNQTLAINYGMSFSLNVPISYTVTDTPPPPATTHVYTNIIAPSLPNTILAEEVTAQGPAGTEPYVHEQAMNEDDADFDTMNNGSYIVSVDTPNYTGTDGANYKVSLNNPYVIGSGASPNKITIRYVKDIPPVAVSTIINAPNLATSGTVNVKAAGAKTYTHDQAAGTNVFDTMDAGSYTVTAADYTGTDSQLYHASLAGTNCSGNQCTVDDKDTNIEINYTAATPPTAEAVSTNINAPGLPVDQAVLITLANSAKTYSHQQHSGLTTFDPAVVDGTDYTLTCASYTVGSDTYTSDCSSQSPITIDSTHTTININYTKSGPTPPPGPIPGWPGYVAMGDITQGISTFKTAQNKDLDADYLYAFDGGTASYGILVGIPDIAQSLGKNWYKMFYLLHHPTSAAGFSAPADVRAAPVYYSNDSGSGGLAGNYANDPTKVNPEPYTSANNMSPGNLTVQYANLINFLALIRNESIRQPNLTVSIVYNPDLLGKMYQEGNGTTHWIDLPLGDVKSSLEHAVNEVTFPDGTPIAIDQDAKKILKDNLAAIESAMDSQNLDNSKAYLNSINVLTKTLLSAPNCTTCQNISFGWQLNAWFAGGNANNLRAAGSGAHWGKVATDWLKGTGLFSGPYAVDFLVFDKYEADGLTASGISNGYFWNWQTEDNYVEFISTISHGLSSDSTKPFPVILFQIPASHLPDTSEATTFPFDIANHSVMAARIDDNTNYILGNKYINSPSLTALANTTNISLDVLATQQGATVSPYYCGSSKNSCQTIAQAAGINSPSDLVNFQSGHLAQLIDAGVVAILWGGGDYSRTTSGYCPFPSTAGACSGGTAPSIYNDDQGWLARVMDNYYANPAVLNKAKNTGRRKK